MATKVFKVALPGRNAYEDQDPDHFALFVDQRVDYILIKQKQKATVSVPSSISAYNIAHNLGYIPFCLVFAEVSTGVWRKIHSTAIDGVALKYEISTTNLVLRNETGSAVNFSYWIFYDNVTD